MSLRDFFLTNTPANAIQRRKRLELCDDNPKVKQLLDSLIVGCCDYADGEGGGGDSVDAGGNKSARLPAEKLRKRAQDLKLFSQQVSQHAVTKATPASLAASRSGPGSSQTSMQSNVRSNSPYSILHSTSLQTPESKFQLPTF